MAAASEILSMIMMMKLCKGFIDIEVLAGR